MKSLKPFLELFSKTVLFFSIISIPYIDTNFLFCVIQQ